MKTLYTLGLFWVTLSLFSQTATITGTLLDSEGEAVIYANVALYQDSTLVKVETSNEDGLFTINDVNYGDYSLVASSLGFPDYRSSNVEVKQSTLNLGELRFQPAGIELATATVTTSRAIVEVKPDRTVFNVQGTINAVGEDGLSLLRKAPGVTVDNNDNINVLSRSGVLLYVDGKRLPLAGADLSNYLRSLTAEQIDRIDIITNPGARYEAEGNAGIIDIRLKKNENEGANGSANFTTTQGRYNRMNGGLGGNYRNKKLNAFARIGAVKGENYNRLQFNIFQNGIELKEYMNNNNTWENVNFRAGTDFFLGEKHTVGFLLSGQSQDGIQNGTDNFEMLTQGSNMVDSLLFAGSRADDTRKQATFNLNYRFTPTSDKTLNIDLDYGRFRNTSLRNQPNITTTPDRETILSREVNNFDTPIDIDIYTFQTDYEQPLAGGTFGTGIRLSRVSTENTFLFYTEVGTANVFDESRSNLFDYEENVYAAYLNYARKLNEKVSFSAGLRVEATDAIGELTAFDPTMMEDPVDLEYLSYFPSAGVTYQLNKPGNSIALNYSRRINRPDYNVLNPFRNQASQLSFETGNPFLRPEIVDNVEFGYTIGYRYNFKLAFSKTSDQITRLLRPDPVDPKAGSITWDNLASQKVYAFNASAPVQIGKIWNAYFNLSTSYINNQADYGNGVTIDVQAFSYTLFQQHTFTLPKAFTFEVSGYYSGPGIWGGVFEYDPSWALGLGVQKRFFNNQLNVKLSGNDLFNQAYWSGFSNFDGQFNAGEGRWDSRSVALSLSYNFGNQKVKSRKRSTSIGKEAERVGG